MMVNPKRTVVSDEYDGDSENGSEEDLESKFIYLNQGSFQHQRQRFVGRDQFQHDVNQDNGIGICIIL